MLTTYSTSVLPKQKPTISDSNQLASPVYSINDTINITCILAQSRPLAKISWLLNDSPLPEQARSVKNESNEEPNKSSLSINVQPQHLLSSPDARLRFKCLAKLALDFSSETQISLLGVRAGGLRRRAQFVSRELPVPLPLHEAIEWTGTENEPTELRPKWPNIEALRNSSQSIYRWPPSRHSGLARPNDSPESTEAALDPSKRRPSPSRVSVWRQMRSQSDYIEHILRLTRPNQIDPPTIEARIISSADPTSKGTLEERSSNIQMNEYELDDLVEFTCRPRLDPQTAMLSGPARIRWFLNNQPIAPLNSSYKVTSFEGDKFRIEWTRTGSEDELEQVAPPSDGAQKHVIEATGEPRLVIEFTKLLFQLKELNLKCQTWIEQPLIEYESQELVVQIASNQFIQVDKQPTVGRPGPQARHPHYYNSNRRASPRPAKARQAPSSGCAPTTEVDRPTLLVVLVAMFASFAMARLG